MDLRQLRYFAKIAELGSFSRASQALHIAQPALSQHIAQLESELGQPLFRRLSTGVRPTEQGQVLYRHALCILKQVAEVKAAVAHAGASPTGSVAIGLPQSTALQYAMPLLEQLPQRYPNVRAEFFDEISGNLLHGLTAGRLDIAVVVNDEDEALLKSTPLLRERLYLISRVDMAPRTSQIALRELGLLPLTLPSHGHGVRDMLEQAIRAHGACLPTPKIIANSMNIMRSAVLRGMAHTVMPWNAVHEEIESGLLEATPIEPLLQRTAYLCVSREGALTTAAEAVFELLLARIREQAPHWRGVELISAMPG